MPRKQIIIKPIVQIPMQKKMNKCSYQKKSKILNKLIKKLNKFKKKIKKWMWKKS